jgi:hypothetical protein
MRTRHHFIPIDDAQVGMVLSQPASVVDHGFLNLTLPAGHTLTQENLNQLIAHHAEFIFIDRSDSRSDQEVALDAAEAARRIMQIFSGVDLSEPNMMAFFDQILAYRSA